MLPNFDCCIFLRDLPFFEYTILDWVQSHWPGWICVPSVKVRMPRQIEWESVLGKLSNTVWRILSAKGVPPPHLRKRSAKQYFKVSLIKDIYLSDKIPIFFNTKFFDTFGSELSTKIAFILAIFLTSNRKALFTPRERANQQFQEDWSFKILHYIFIPKSSG